MTSQTETAYLPKKTGKLLLQLLLGAVSGGLAMSGIIWALHRQEGLLDDPARMAALGTAMVYALMAVIVGLGSAAPRVGSHALNVEDADELIEQRPNLLIGAVSFLLVALLLTALAVAQGPGVDGVLAPRTAGLIAAACGIALSIMTVAYRNRGDEMMRAVSREASSWTLAFVFLLFGSWSALAHLALASPFKPLLFVAGFFALYLLAVFVAAGRRGMMKPR
jgi:cytochrome bd-type quinol oxidase subunit 2